MRAAGSGQTSARPDNSSGGDSQFRNWITPDGAAGPSGTADFKPEAGR